MAYDLNGSADYFEVGSAVATAAPLSMACWFNPDNTTAALALIAVGVSGGSHRFQLAIVGSAAGDPVRASAIDAGTGDANTSTGYSAGAWQHAAGVFASTTSRSAFLNGGGKVTDTTSVSPSGLNITDIGVRWSGTRGLFFAGLIAEVGIWGAALTDEEVSALAKGVSPLKVRPQSLAFYAPLIRSVQDVRKGVAITTAVSPTVAAHPRIHY